MKVNKIKFRIHHNSLPDKWGYYTLEDDIISLMLTIDFDKINFMLWSGYEDFSTQPQKMYEGDIVKFTEGDIGERTGKIVFCQERNRNGFYIVGLFDNFWALNEYFIQSSKPIIIGNIIDDKHLLK
jgi:hypothetical protein